jgi:hypothetical protein
LLGPVPPVRLEGAAGGVRSWILFVIAARSPAPAPIARIPMSRKSSDPAVAPTGPAGEGEDRPGEGGGGGIDRERAARAASLCASIVCIMLNSSVASSIVICRVRNRPTR